MNIFYLDSEQIIRIEPILVPKKKATIKSDSLTFDLPNLFGKKIKEKIHQASQKFSEYFLKIKIENELNQKPKILGEWAFGTKIYQGHLLFQPQKKDKIVIYCPENSPLILLQLINQAVYSLFKK